MRNLSRKTLSIVMSIVLVVGLCPGLVYADDGRSAPDSSAESNLVAGLSQDIVAQETGAIDAMNAQAIEALTGDGSRIVQLSLGWYHSAAIVSDGSLWTWGFNDYGQLGDGTKTGRLTPVKVMDGAAQVSLGSYHSAAIKSDGSLWTWGHNDYGQLGDGTTTDRFTPVKVMDGAAQVSLEGYHHSAVVKSDGSLWTWGGNSYGQLGDGTTTSRPTPAKIMDGVAQVSLAADRSAVVKSDGSLWTWGCNGYGELGDGTTTDRLTPVKVMDGAMQVSLGSYHSAAIKSDGSLWTWGHNDYGELGDSTTMDRYEPAKVMSDIVQVSLGANHSAAVKSDGSLWTWGHNFDGELGDGTITDRSLPTCIFRDGVWLYGSDAADTEKAFDKLLESPSSNYDNDLALMSAKMSLATYTSDGGNNSSDIEDYLRKLGFKNPQSKNYGSATGKAFTVATKEYHGADGDGNTNVLVVVAQGSTNAYELIKDATAWPSNSYHGYKVYDIVGDFTREMLEATSEIMEEGKYYKVLVTGHSLGGAAADLLVAAMDNVATNKDDVFCYTFGAVNAIDSPSVVSAGYENIHNVYNVYDTFSPLQFGSYLPTGMGKGLGKFGHMDLYVKDHRSKEDKKQHPLVQIADHVNHDMDQYIADIERSVVKHYVTHYGQHDANGMGESDLRTGRSIVACPVDVDVYRDGELVGRVVDDVVTVSDAGLEIEVEDSAKVIYYPDDHAYTLSIQATDEGSMSYLTQLLSDEDSAKVIAGVALEPGKLFASDIDQDGNIKDIGLYVVDENGSATAEVQEDGTEVPIASGDIASGTWGTCPWEISAEGVLTIGAGAGAQGDSDILSVPWSEHRDEIKSVTTNGTVVLPASCWGMFNGYANLESADLLGFDTSNVTNMHQMFSNCTSLKSLGLASWSTSNVTDMESMFWMCSSLESLDVTSFDTSNVQNMLCMFAYCSSLETIDLSHFSTVSATRMARMFEGCESLAELDLSTFDTSKATSMRWTFSACFALQKVTLGEKFSFGGSGDDVKAVLPGTSWHSQKDDAWYAPEDISAARGNIADVYTRPVGQDVARGTWGTCEWAIDSDFVLTIGPGIGVTSSGYDFALADSGYWAYTSRIKAVKTSGKVVLPADSSHLFEFCSNLESADLSGFDTSGVEDMSGMFMNCGSLESLDLSSFDTTNVANMSRMFQCTLVSSRLQTLDLSSFDTTKAKDMGSMFTGCLNLKTVSVGEKWSTQGVTSSNRMFSGCTSLVGGAGTAFDAAHVDAEYARVDAPGAPGYLTLKAGLSEEGPDDSGDGNDENGGDPAADDPVKDGPAAWTRFAGENAYGTMAKIVEAGWPDGSGAVVVATFDGYWDALTASGLAGFLGCPVLMTDTNSLSATTRSEIERLGARTAFVAGGEAAVSAGVEAELSAMGLSVVRAAGDNAAGTARDAYEKAKGYGEWGKTAIVATADGYWDALAMSPYSYCMHAPIFLAQEPAGGAMRLDAGTLAAIRAGGFDTVLVAGGTAAVSPDVESQLSGLAVERLAGETAVETSRAIAAYCASHGMSKAKVAVATTDGYWDALTGAALCGKTRTPMVLASPANAAGAADGFVSSEASTIAVGYIFGGEAAVAPASEAALKEVTK